MLTGDVYYLYIYLLYKGMLIARVGVCITPNITLCYNVNYVSRQGICEVHVNILGLLIVLASIVSYLPKVLA